MYIATVDITMERTRIITFCVAQETTNLITSRLEAAKLTKIVLDRALWMMRFVWVSDQNYAKKVSWCIYISIYMNIYISKKFIPCWKIDFFTNIYSFSPNRMYLLETNGWMQPEWTSWAKIWQTLWCRYSKWRLWLLSMLWWYKANDEEMF